MEDFGKIIEDEFTRRNQEIIDKNNSLKKSLEKEKNKNKILQEKIDTVQESLDIIEAGKNITGLLNEDEIIRFIDLPVTFDIQRPDECPVWIYLLIKHYENRKNIINIFKFFNFKIPDWAKNIKLPHEWNKEECLYFVKNISNHSIYNPTSMKIDSFCDRWIHEEKFCSPKKMIDDHFAHIPSFLILKNPLWIKDNDLFDAIIKVMEKKVYNSEVFMYLENWNKEKLSNDKMKRLCSALTKFDQNKIAEFILSNFNRLEIQEDDKLYTFTLNKLVKENSAPNDNACIEIHKFYVSKIEALSDKIKYIENCKKFSIIQKAELINKYVYAIYSDVAISKVTLAN